MCQCGMLIKKIVKQNKYYSFARRVLLNFRV